MGGRLTGEEGRLVELFLKERYLASAVLKTWSSDWLGSS
jgi:hypothetical protein